jgi:hypothetical protein
VKKFWQSEGKKWKTVIKAARALEELQSQIDFQFTAEISPLLLWLLLPSRIWPDPIIIVMVSFFSYLLLFPFPSISLSFTE